MFTKIYPFLFVDTIVHKRTSQLILKIDRIKAISIGSIYIIFSICMLYYYMDNFPFNLFSIPFCIYGILNIIAALRYNVIIDKINNYIIIEFLFKTKKFTIDQINVVELEKIGRSYFLNIKFSNKEHYYIAFFRYKHTESQTYSLVQELEAIGIPFKDKTIPYINLYPKKKLSNKLHILSPYHIQLKIGWKDIPKDFYIISGVLLSFSGFMIITLPPNAPVFIHIGFPLITLLAAIIFIILGYKDGYWELEKHDDLLIIKRLFFNKTLSITKLDLKEIIRVVPRLYAYRSSNGSSFEKGYSIHLITRKKTFKIGAFLSAEDVKNFFDFLGLTLPIKDK